MRINCIWGRENCRLLGILLQRLRRPSARRIVGGTRPVGHTAKILSGGCAEGRHWFREHCCGCFILTPFNFLVGQTFKRIPTRAEWARFQKYSRRIRTLRPNPRFPLSQEVFPVLQHCTLSAPLLPGLKALLCPELTASFAPFICFSPKPP